MITPQLFISSTTQDKVHVAWLVRWLKHRDVRVWHFQDEKVKYKSSVVSESIGSQLAESTHVLVYWSNAARKSRWVRSEVDFAFKYGKELIAIHHEPDLKLMFPLENLRVIRGTGFGTSHEAVFAEVIDWLQIVITPQPQEADGHATILRSKMMPDQKVALTGGVPYRLVTCKHAVYDVQEVWNAQNILGQRVVAIIVFSDNRPKSSSELVAKCAARFKDLRKYPDKRLQLLGKLHDLFLYDVDATGQHCYIAITDYDEKKQPEDYYNDLAKQVTHTGGQG